MVTLGDTKVCATCAQEKPLDAFHRCSSFADGRYNRCAGCRQAARRVDTVRARAIREQRELRAEGLKRCYKCGKVKALADGFYSNASGRDGRDGYASACRECVNQAGSARQKRDRAAANARHKRWRDAHRESFNESARMWAANRRGRVRGAFVENIDPQVVLERDEAVCGICGEGIDPGPWDVDHIKPLSQGGEHSYANVQAAHVFCNRSKGGALGAALNNAKETI